MNEPIKPIYGVHDFQAQLVIPMAQNPPSQPINGSVYIDTDEPRIYAWYEGRWIAGDSAHVADPNAHPQYLTQAEGDLLYSSVLHTHPSETTFYWTYDSVATMSDPGTGKIRTDTASGVPSTQVAFSDITARSVDASATIQSLAVGDLIYFQQQNNAANWGRYTIESPPVDNETWWLIGVAAVEQHGGAIAKNQEVLVRFTYGTGGGGGGGGITEAAADTRYVNVTGDTMTGDLHINNSQILTAGEGRTGVLFSGWAEPFGPGTWFASSDGVVGIVSNAEVILYSETGIVLGAPSIDVGGVQVQNVATPTTAADAATKQYVDDAAMGGGNGVTDHGALTGLADDDHIQYALANGTRGTFEVVGAVATHVAAADPHTGYQLESEKGTINGYASLDGATKVPLVQLPTGTSGTTVALGNAAAALITTHEGAADPHTGYQLESEKNTASGYAGLTAGKLAYAQLPTGTAASTVAIGDHTHTSSTISALDTGDITTGTFTIGFIPTGTTATTVALGNHLHTGVYDPVGTATTAVANHAAAVDPHTGYQLESEKASASGYASLDASTKIPIAQLPTGTTATTVSLGNHIHAAADTTTGTFAIGRIPTGTTSSTVSLGDHLHTGVYDPAGTAASRTPKVTVAGTAPGSPATNDIWIDTT